MSASLVSHLGLKKAIIKWRRMKFLPVKYPEIMSRVTAYRCLNIASNDQVYSKNWKIQLEIKTLRRTHCFLITIWNCLASSRKKGNLRKVWGYVQKSGQGAVFFEIAIGAKLLAGAKRCLPMLEINTPVKHILTNQKRYIFTLCHLFFALWLHRNNKSNSDGKLPTEENREGHCCAIEK